MNTKQIITLILLSITIIIPLFFDAHLHSVSDLGKLTVLYISIFIIIIIWAIKGNLPKWSRNPLTYPIIAILISTIISTALSINPYISLVGTYKRYGGLISTIIYIILFFAVVEFVPRIKIKLFINTIIATAVIASMYAVFQYIGIDIYTWSESFNNRPYATFGHPAFFSAYVIMAICLILPHILDRKWYIYSIIGLLIFAVFVSQSMSAFIGMIISSIYFLILYRKKISYKLIGLALMVIIGLSFIPNSPIKRFTYDLSGYKPSGSIATRIGIAMPTLDIIKDNLITGIGPDCLSIVFPRYYELRYNRPCPTNHDRPHNAVLKILLSQGIIGLLAWFYFFTVYFRMVFRNRCNILAIALSGGVIAYGIQNMFSLSSVPIIALFWTLIGLTVLVIKYEKRIYTRIHYPVNRDKFGAYDFEIYS